MIQPILLLIVLIFLNATFASAEIAVISVNEAKLRKLSGEGNKKARKLLLLTEQPARFLATIQVAITLAGLLQSAFAAENFADPLVAVMVGAGVPVPEAVLKNGAIVVITLILAYFNLVFGELVPKRLAMKKAEQMALGMSGMLYGVSKAFAPLVWLLTASTNGVLRLLHVNPEEEDEQVTEEEIRLMLSEGNEQGNIQTEETELIRNVFEFNDIPVEEICTHRKDVVLLRMEDGPEVWNETICANRYTHYPICGVNKDEILAVLDTRDYFRMESRSREDIMEQATDQPFFIPESMRANVLFREMKKSRSYFAVVLDEYGGTSGIVTLHDLVETLVGEIDDEEGENDPDEIEQVNESTWRIYGTAPLRDVSEALEADLDCDDCATFSGYVSRLIDRVPEDGETFECEDDRLKISVRGVKDHVIGLSVVELKPVFAGEEN